MQCGRRDGFHQQRSGVGVDGREPYGLAWGLAAAADWSYAAALGEQTAAAASQRGPDFAAPRWHRARFVMPHFVCGRMGVILLVQLGWNAAGLAH